MTESATASKGYLTFVLGAGASVPYGFPTGDALVRNLANRMETIEPYDENSPTLYDGNSPTLYARRLRLYDPLSIDDYLQKHFSTNKAVEKLHRYAITDEILESLYKAFFGDAGASKAEDRHSKFGQHNAQNWLRFLIPEWIKLFESGIPENPIKIITFNYDISIELYLDKIVQFYGTDANKREEFLRWFAPSILHVYGQIGHLSWQQVPQTDATTKHTIFDVWHLLDPKNQRHHENLAAWKDHLRRSAEEYVDNFHLIGDPRGKIDVAAQAREWIRNSQTLVFSGYAFHDENNKVLELEKIKTLNPYPKEIHLGLYSPDNNPQRKLRELILHLFPPIQHGGANQPNILSGTENFWVYQNGGKVLIHPLSTYDLLKDELNLKTLYKSPEPAHTTPPSVMPAQAGIQPSP